MFSISSLIQGQPNVSVPRSLEMHEVMHRGFPILPSLPFPSLPHANATLNAEKGGSEGSSSPVSPPRGVLPSRLGRPEGDQGTFRYRGEAPVPGDMSGGEVRPTAGECQTIEAKMGSAIGRFILPQKLCSNLVVGVRAQRQHPQRFLEHHSPPMFFCAATIDRFVRFSGC